MKQGYVKLGLVLAGLTLVVNLMACTPAGMSSENGMQDDTLTAVKEEVSELSGEYVIENETESGVLKVYGPTPSEEIMFSLVMTTENGCAIERSGRAQLVEKHKAVFYQVNTNCHLEFLFDGQAVQVIQNNCPERDTVPCTFDGTYVLSMQ